MIFIVCFEILSRSIRLGWAQCEHHEISGMLCTFEYIPETTFLISFEIQYFDCRPLQLALPSWILGKLIIWRTSMKFWAPVTSDSNLWCIAGSAFTSLRDSVPRLSQHLTFTNLSFRNVHSPYIFSDDPNLPSPYLELVYVHFLFHRF